MEEYSFRIDYDGGDASKHHVDMRLLGRSLQGADKITSDGLILLIHGRLPRRGERAPVILKAREPIQGSAIIQATYETALMLLPLGMPIAADIASNFLTNWWTAIKAKFSGRPDVAETAIQAAVDLTREHLAARDAAEQRIHERDMSHHALLMRALSMQQRPMEDFAAPIGPSVHTGQIRHFSAPPVTINTEEAEQIREAGKVSWTKLHELTLRTEGFRFHTNGLSVENPMGEGYLMARVRDPQFEELENPYTLAAQRKSEIVVLGRMGYKDGEVVSIDIVDFIRENPS